MKGGGGMVEGGRGLGVLWVWPTSASQPLNTSAKVPRPRDASSE